MHRVELVYDRDCPNVPGAGWSPDRRSSKGVTVARRREGLWVRPLPAVTAEIVEIVQAHKAELLLELCEVLIRWRVNAMVPQVPRSGPIRSLAARDGAWRAEICRCGSCGDLFESRTVGGPFGGSLRCGPCLEATEIALAIGRLGGLDVARDGAKTALRRDRTGGVDILPARRQMFA